MNRFFESTGKHFVAFLLALALASPLNAQVSLREALDFDGDGKVDWSVFRPSDFTWYVLGSTGNVKFQPWGDAVDDVQTPGDYDGDNKADIAVWRESNGVWYILNSSNNTFTGIYWGLSGDQPVQRDYDGDGKTDPAIVRRVDGFYDWWILRSSDGGYNGYRWGIEDTDNFVTGDYDGDGKFDLGAQRLGPTIDAPATFYFLCSTEGFKAIQYGIGVDVTVPGDYDGDGKTDLAVVRPGLTRDDAMIWYILRSTDNNYYGVYWGITGEDIFTQGDYDGDGKTDVAVWRNSNGTFYVLNSSNGGFQFVNWGNPNDLPIASYDQY